MKILSYLILLLISCVTAATSQAQEASQLPEAAVRLQSAYAQSVEAATKPHRDRYIADLQKLLEQSTRASKLEEAIALKKEIERVTTKAEADSLTAKILGKWKEAPENAGVITIGPNGKAQHSNGATATWEARNGNIILTWSNQFKHEFPYAEIGSTIRGKLYDPQGKGKPWSASRLP